MNNKIIEHLTDIKIKFSNEIKYVNSIDSINIIQKKYIGPRSLIFEVLKDLSKCSYKTKKKIGPIVNENFAYIKKEVKQRYKSVRLTFKKENFDCDNVSIPNDINKYGYVNPLVKVYETILYILSCLDFNLVSGPEIEHTFYNFDKLNIKYNHPSRNFADTFYIKRNIVLRTHTSSVQIRILAALKEKLPVRITSCGKVYRRDSDSTHSPMFHQLEVLYVDKNVSFSELKSLLIEFICKFFKKKISVRWRMNYFPFTEPSCELDIACFLCQSRGCRVCSNSGWIEVMGAGLVNPLVLSNLGIDNNKSSGLAFGVGIERFAMVYYNLSNIKLFFDNILRITSEF